MPTGIKIDKQKPFDGSTKDPSVLNSFIYACKLYFKLINLNYPSQQALMALLWLEGEVAVWWQLVKAGYPLDQLTWRDLKALLQHQFRAVDAAQHARDAWAACVQGKGTVRRYVDDLRRKLLYVNDAAPAEVLDRFVRGLSAPVRAQVLVANP